MINTCKFYEKKNVSEFCILIRDANFVNFDLKNVNALSNFYSSLKALSGFFRKKEENCSLLSNESVV